MLSMAVRWLGVLLLAMSLVIGAEPSWHNASAQGTTLYPSPNERLGFGVTTDIALYDVGQLHAGWYVNWGATSQTRNPAGLEYVQIIRVCDPQYRPNICSTPTYFPSGQALVDIVTNNPGTLWLIGNEPDRIYAQDSVHPTVYAQLYHELYYLIKSLDPTARVAIGGMVQATVVRMKWLDMVWSEYQRLYGTDMPVDVWNVHNFVLREVRAGYGPQCAPPGSTDYGAWGADIPPGVPDNCGLWIEIDELDRMDLFRSQIQRFRTWMRDHGQRDKELIISEYGILFNQELGYDLNRVRSYLYNTFDYMMTATDASTGMPADGNRLVQRWAWYSLDDDSFGWGTTWGALFDPDTRQITPMGEAFAAYAERYIVPYVDLRPKSITYWLTQPPLWDTDPVGLHVEASYMNAGNTSTAPFHVRFWDGAPGAGSVIATQSVPGLSARYEGQGTAAVDWLKVGAHGATLSFQIDSANEVSEWKEDNNSLATVIDLPYDLAISSPVASAPFSPHGDPVDVHLSAQVYGVGGRGASQDLTVQFWLGDPDQGGTLLGSTVVPKGSSGRAQWTWSQRPPGIYEIYARLVDSTGEDADLSNNKASTLVLVGTYGAFFPLVFDQ